VTLVATGRRAEAGLHAERPAAPPALPAWPLAWLLAAYPLWWALGLGVLIFPLAAAPMAWLLLRARAGGRRIALPPGFGWWAVFLLAVVVSIGALGADPAGTVPGTAASRIEAVAYRLGMYLALTVLLVYAGNLRREELSVARITRLLAWLFVVTVAGGLLGMFAGRFELTSPVELLLPGNIRSKGFVQSLVHPYAAQVMDVGGGPTPRPAAPWGYTNTWGNNFCLLVGFLVAAVWGQLTRAGTKLLALGVLAVSVAPMIYSLNRGLWIGLAVAAGYVAVRYALMGRLWIIGGVVVAGLALGTALLATPLGAVVGDRMENGKSNGVRSFLIERALDGISESPVIGFGSTRDTMGGRQSITIGESADCERCGNFTVGGNGQFWQVLYAHGLVGTLGYLGFFVTGLWRFRRDRSGVGIAASTAIVTSFSSMFVYNSLVTPLAFMFLAYALLWRNCLPDENEVTP
jgi:hypothetical protein